MNESRSWAQGSRCYEQFKVVDDMNDSGSRELRHLDAMNNLEMWIIWTILGRELKALDSMNSSRLLMTSSTLIHELKALDVMNDLELWIT